jgi:hypothetical protein
MAWPVRQLTLLQVNLAVPLKKERKHLTGKSVLGSVKLKNGFDSISDHWPATTHPKNLQIIVELPSCKPYVHWVSEISLIVLPPSFSLALPPIFGHLTSPKHLCYHETRQNHVSVTHVHSYCSSATHCDLSHSLHSNFVSQYSHAAFFQTFTTRGEITFPRPVFA